MPINNNDRPERHAISKGDLAAVKTLLDQGQITEAMASILSSKVMEGDQVITLHQDNGENGKIRIAD